MQLQGQGQELSAGPRWLTVVAPLAHSLCFLACLLPLFYPFIPSSNQHLLNPVRANQQSWDTDGECYRVARKGPVGG